LTNSNSLFSLLALFDGSAAFDMVDHQILLERLAGLDWSVQSGPGKCPKRPGKMSETALNLMWLLFFCFTQNLINLKS